MKLLSIEEPALFNSRKFTVEAMIYSKDRHTDTMFVTWLKECGVTAHWDSNNIFSIWDPFTREYLYPKDGDVIVRKDSGSMYCCSTTEFQRYFDPLV